jgi:hypothetical protein
MWYGNIVDKEWTEHAGVGWDGRGGRDSEKNSATKLVGVLLSDCQCQSDCKREWESAAKEEAGKWVQGCHIRWPVALPVACTFHPRRTLLSGGFSRRVPSSKHCGAMNHHVWRRTKHPQHLSTQLNDTIGLT